MDVVFSLLQLAAGHFEIDSLADLGQLLIPEARVPEPLNALEAWLLLQVLKAVDTLAQSPCLAHQVSISVVAHQACLLCSC